MSKYAKNLGVMAPGTLVYACDSGSRNNVSLLFEFAILIRKNECNHLLFCLLSFMKFCARKCYCRSS